jgi:hypothetical protein
MNREEAVDCINDFIEHFDELGFYDYYKDALQMAQAAMRGWVKTADRLPEGDEHDEILGLYKGTDYLLYDIVQLGWLRLHPEMYPYWTNLPQKPEVDA